MRQCEDDGLVVDGPNGPQLFTLKSAEQPYRMLVEQMQEGALTLTPAGDILYCNRRFAELVGAGPESVIGGPVGRFVTHADPPLLAPALQTGRGKHDGHLLTAARRTGSALLFIGTFLAQGIES